jgi:phosphatidylinositol alpha-mannosyltransferase
VATFHSSGELGWMRLGTPTWGFLMERLDYRIAVSARARSSQQRWLPGEYEVIPNGVLVPESAPAAGREHRVVFAGRQEPRKGLQVLLRAWPEIRRRTGLRVTVAGADPLAVRLPRPPARARRGHRRRRVPEPGGADGRAARRKGTGGAVARPGELRHGADPRVRLRAPVVASDIPGYREVLEPEAAIAVPPDDDADALVDAVAALVADEERRRAMGEHARAVAVERYSWPRIARRLVEISRAGDRDRR